MNIVGHLGQGDVDAFFRIIKTSVGVFFKNYSMVHNASLLFFVPLDGHALCTAPKHIKQLRARKNQYPFDYTKHPTTGNIIPAKMNKKMVQCTKILLTIVLMSLMLWSGKHASHGAMQQFTIFTKFFREEHKNDGI